MATRRSSGKLAANSFPDHCQETKLLHRTFGFEYDYDSIMHYRKNWQDSFAKILNALSHFAVNCPECVGSRNAFGRGSENGEVIEPLKNNYLSDNNNNNNNDIV